MAHSSENAKPLTVRELIVKTKEDLFKATSKFNDVCVIRLPAFKKSKVDQEPIDNISSLVKTVAENLGENATLVVLGENVDLVQIQAFMPPSLRYQLWIAIKRTTPRIIDNKSLPQHHFGALVYTRYDASLHHTKTRVAYSYCPVCNKTTKDYGGKKHTYHEYGTALSDVWRDITADLEGDISPITSRIRDLFGLETYNELLLLDLRQVNVKRILRSKTFVYKSIKEIPTKFVNQILQGDTLKMLSKLPDNSVDFVFADPPYNLSKAYSGYSDDLEVIEYFDWCDKWISESARVLKPGRTLALLNIPLWAVRHYLFAQSVLNFQNWIVWDALAFPVRQIMPAHYSMLCFSKGEPRELPGLVDDAGLVVIKTASKSFKSLEPMAEGYCLRSTCINKRLSNRIDDRGPLTDLWWDIHRLKHNSRRVDHPCQLPPQLMYRIISVFTKQGEIVLDPFNGAGTTTLAAHQLQRKYIGIDISEEYCKMAMDRHEEIEKGLDPFRKVERTLTAKNSPVPRMRKQKYLVPKKTLQLEVKRIAIILGKLPTRDEVIEFAKYPIEYYDNYFVSWGEVCAAARTTGMSEDRGPKDSKHSSAAEQLNFMQIVNN
jgi:site-specific DNA-methyltransferase (adenine-specific)